MTEVSNQAPRHTTMSDDAVFEVTVPTGLDQAVTQLEAALADEKFSILWRLDLQAKLAEKGFTFDRPLHILEVCSARHAHRALGTDIRVSNLLPCKITARQEGTETKLSMYRPTRMIGLVSDQLDDLAREVEGALVRAMEQTASR